MLKTEFDPSRIRKCELITINNKQMVQFVGIGDRHQMMKNEDGSIDIIKLPEQGKEYRYGDPYHIEYALEILQNSPDIEHKKLAEQINDYLASL